MEFRTPVETEAFQMKITHRMGGLSLGSCFAGNIARRMQRAKFRIADNPFGVLFNPASIADTIEMLSAGTAVTRSDLSLHDGLWSGFAFHGSFSSADPEVALSRMNGAIQSGAHALRDAEYVIITFGTAWVYELTTDGRVVANCHKFPATAFRRRRLGVGEIVSRFDTLMEGPLAGRTVILTVSPVRHIKDGFPENTLSKAILIEAVHELAARHPGAVYFPAFEIMNDELRDYRFYDADMVHPSPIAVDYIWERFSAAAFDEPTRRLAAEAEKIAAAMEHRPHDADSPGHRRFMADMLRRTRELSARMPDTDFSAEADYFSETI